jgi:hypothetical protein
MKYLYFWLRFVRHASQGMLTTGKWRNFGGAGAESRTVGGAIRCAKPCTLTRTVVGGQSQPFVAPKKRSRVIRARIRGQQLANNSLWKPKKTN